MQFLNIKATEIFSQLIDSLNGGTYRAIENKPFMPLTLECIGEDVQTEWGTAKLFSLCHYFIQNGDLMQDPEMCFFIIDTRNGLPPDQTNMKIAPYMFQQASMGIYQESVLIEKDGLKVINNHQQLDQTLFANLWMYNIRDQGFLKV